jgi:rfaE bifunctional protein kinase chain/domain/rfaE bifunctional protein nucleotidyltransferase chain/domain
MIKSDKSKEVWNKIKKIEELAQILTSIRIEKKIVLCHGVFDLLHIGHIRHLEQARRMGDILVVTITPDNYVDKGPHRPAFTDALRAEAIASLNCVDYVAINQWPTAEETLRLLRPNIFVKGSEFKSIASDMTGKIGKEEQVIREIGATLAFTEDIVFSSTNLINRYLSNFPEEVQQYIDLFRQRYDYQEVLEIIDKMASLNVLVIGDTILDEYQYCEAIGKSSKDPVLVVKYQSHDLFAGGVLAVANHVANFANKVQLVTILGEHNSYEDFIKSRLCSNIMPHFVIQPHASTLIKRRFIDGYSFNKLFEVYVMDGYGLLSEEDSQLCSWLNVELPKYDLVIAADYGHGAISNNMANNLVKNGRFLAVNTQANAGNRGFHTVTRYPKANYVCLAEHEMRLEMRDLNGSLRPMMDTISQKLGCSYFVVTRGRKGCLVSSNQGDFIAVPSFAQKVVDRVGAGDAFFSVTALAAVQGIPIEQLGFIGNVAGSLSVETLGNQRAIDKLSTKKYVISLLK